MTEAHAAYMRRWRAAHPDKARVIERASQLKKLAKRRAIIAKERSARGDACADCGATERLEWHHRDPASKNFSIGALRGVAYDALRAELAACDLLCIVCHKARHRRSM